MKMLAVILLLITATKSLKAQEITPEQLKIAEQIAAEIDPRDFSTEQEYDEYVIDEIDYQLYEYNSDKSARTIGRVIWNTIKPSTAEAATHNGRGKPDSKRERTRLRNRGGRSAMRWRSP